MSEDMLVLIFVAVMAVVLIIVFAFVKKRIGQMPKMVQERYEGKINADCKVRYYYCFVIFYNIFYLFHISSFLLL